MDDINNAGSHINDELNYPDAQGRVLVNVGHPEKEEDIFLPSQLAAAVKPHQVCNKIILVFLITISINNQKFKLDITVA